MKTADGGTSWTRVRVNQNASGSYEWCPAVNVDATGAINVCYYSTRNVPTADSAEIYLSRSTDGGLTFVDVKVSDHKFKPIPISGLAAGYQGDYIGITSGGEGKILPYWCEQNPSTGGRYQAYSALVDVTQPAPCEDFSCNRFNGTAAPMYTSALYEEQISGTNYWARQTQTAYGIGAGSARFNAWSASAGTIQNLTTYQFSGVGANTYLTFDEAYAPWSGGNVDSLIVESSINGGTTWSNRARLWGGLGTQAGPLNTVFIGGGEFTPSTREWASKIYLLPVGTNKVRLRGVSGFGNDIWIDNVCVQSLPTPVAKTIGLASEGMWTGVDPYWAILDTVTVFLHRGDFPNVKVDSTQYVVTSNAVLNTVNPFSRALDGNYYRVVKHRNSIETWSAVPVAYTRGSGTNHWNFVFPAGQAFGNNQHIVDPGPPYYGMFSGDCIKDPGDIIDASDLVDIYNAVTVIATGYIRQDLNGDDIADASDVIIAYNNSINIVTVVRPPGAAPGPAPDIQNEKVPEFKTDAERQKYELTKMLAAQNFKHQERNLIREANPELYDMTQKIIEERSKKVKTNSFDQKSKTNSGPKGRVVGSN